MRDGWLVGRQRLIDYEHGSPPVATQDPGHHHGGHILIELIIVSKSAHTSLMVTTVLIPSPLALLGAKISSVLVPYNERQEGEAGEPTGQHKRKEKKEDEEEKTTKPNTENRNKSNQGDDS